MENPATPADLTEMGFTVTDDAVAQRWLDVAWRALQREKALPGLVARIQSGELGEADVIDVIAAAAGRVLRNPEGYESESGGIDDYQESVKRSDATMDVYFTAAEIRRLAADYSTNISAGSMKYR